MEVFLRRHPELALRKAQNINPARAHKLNHSIVNDYFDKLRKIMDELDLFDKPNRFFNVDEKACTLTLHYQQTVLAARRTKRVLRSSENAKADKKENEKKKERRKL